MTLSTLIPKRQLNVDTKQLYYQLDVGVSATMTMTSSGNVQVHLMTPPSAPARKDCPVLEDEIVATRSFSVSVGIGRQGCCCLGFNWALSGLMVVVHSRLRGERPFLLFARFVVAPDLCRYRIDEIDVSVDLAGRSGTR